MTDSTIMIASQWNSTGLCFDLPWYMFSICVVTHILAYWMFRVIRCPSQEVPRAHLHPWLLWRTYHSSNNKRKSDLLRVFQYRETKSNQYIHDALVHAVIPSSSVSLHGWILGSHFQLTSCIENPLILVLALALGNDGKYLRVNLRLPLECRWSVAYTIFSGMSDFCQCQMSARLPPEVTYNSFLPVISYWGPR